MFQAPKGGIADEGPGGMIVGQRGPQTESDPYLERIKQNKLTPYSNPGMAPSSDNSERIFGGPQTGGPGAMMGKMGGVGVGGGVPAPQAPKGGGFDPRTQAPRSQQMMAKGGSIKAKKGGSIKAKNGGSVKSSASKRADGCATKGKTRGKMC
jgi:hypothetical protein